MAFEVRPAEIEEIEEGEAEEVAVENAVRKVSAIRPNPGEIVIGVDTIVALDDTIHGKPADAAHARATLRALAGRTHEVVSGIAVLAGGLEARAVTTRVSFRALTDAWLDWYVATGEWQGRAGGYAIQGRGAALVERIEGDYLNVVGLPVSALLAILPELLP